MSAVLAEVRIAAGAFRGPAALLSLLRGGEAAALERRARERRPRAPLAAEAVSLDSPEGEIRLVDACLAGDEGAWDAFVETFAPLVTRVVHLRLCALGRELGAVEDIVQEVFLHLVESSCRRLRNFEPARGRLAAYVATIADRVTRDRAASQRREQVRRTDFARELGEAVSPGFVGRVEDRELSSLLREAADSLPPRERLALRLFYEQGLTYPEVALALGVTEGTVASTLSRARDALREMLSGVLARSA
jgi:RNA polymerase sigma-70 factor (ECF subfamily)